MKTREKTGPIPHDQPLGHLGEILPAFCPQIAPVVPVSKCCAVYSLDFEALHGMELVSLQADIFDSYIAASSTNGLLNGMDSKFGALQAPATIRICVEDAPVEKAASFSFPSRFQAPSAM